MAQRLAVRSKMTDDGQEPHLLMMTATPIPRTLAMSYYADLDGSTIDVCPWPINGASRLALRPPWPA
jgi:ATP-dependent DNA helicase RecG